MPDETKDEIVAVYHSFAGRIYGYCARRLYRSDLAEEAVSACFLRFVEEYGKLRSKSNLELRNWLYGAASNAIAKILRDKKRLQLIQSDVAKDVAVSMPPGDGMLVWPALYQAMDKLRYEEREILILRFYEDMETSEIAKILELRHVTVRVRLSRAVKRLKQHLGRSIDELQETF